MQEIKVRQARPGPRPILDRVSLIFTVRPRGDERVTPTGYWGATGRKGVTKAGLMPPTWLRFR